jgi:uncharacterized protein (DUF3084 family)
MPLQRSLPEAVPPYEPDLARLYQQLGMRDDRIAQLEGRCTELAQAANEQHERAEAGEKRVAELEQALADAEVAAFMRPSVVEPGERAAAWS